MEKKKWGRGVSEDVQAKIPWQGFAANKNYQVLIDGKMAVGWTRTD